MSDMVTSLKVVAVVEGTKKVENLNENIDKLGSNSDSSGEKIDKLGRKTESLLERLKRASEEIKNSTTERDKLNNSLSTTIKKYLGIAAAASVIKKAVGEFAIFDTEIRKVSATVGANAEQMEKLRKQAKELGATTSWNATQSAQAQFEFAKAGFTVNEILEATPSILNTAKVAQIGLAEATEITAGTLRMFRLEADEAQRVGDILALTANSSSTDIQGLGESLKYAGLEAYGMGLSLEETAAILGTLGNMKIDSSMAGTGLRSVFAALKEEAKQQKLINIGVQLTENGKFRNFLKILDDVKKKTNNMVDAQKETFLNDVFGKEGNVVVKALLETNEEEFDNFLEKLQNAEGYSKRIAEMMDGGLRGALYGLDSALSGVGITLIGSLEPAILGTIKAVTMVIRGMNSFIEYLNGTSTGAIVLNVVLGTLATTFILYKSYVIALTTATAAYNFVQKNAFIITQGIKIAQLALTVVTGILTGSINVATIATWGLNAALAVLNAPILVVVGAISALGVGFYYLYKKSEWFRNSINPLINALKKLWDWVKKFTVVGNVIDGVKNMINKIKGEKSIVDVEVATGNKKAYKNIETGTGENTDYLLGATGEGQTTSPVNYVHNGYYLKGNKGGKVNNSNIYRNSVTNTSVAPQKSFEEKILEVLISIKEKLTTNANTNITINNKEAGEGLSKIVDDLIIAVGNK